jgi:hypothetical protein
VQRWVVRCVLGKTLDDGLKLVEGGVGEIGEGPVRPEQRRLVLNREPEYPLVRVPALGGREGLSARARIPYCSALRLHLRTGGIAW